MLLVAILASAMLGACGDDAPEDNRRVTDHADDVEAGTPMFGVYNALKAMGTPVEMGGPVEQPLFDADGRKMTVNGAAVDVYEFDSKEEADKAAATVAPTGAVKNSAAIKPPVHFYRSDLVFVVYAGDDPVVKDAIVAAAGEQFAGTP